MVLVPAPCSGYTDFLPATKTNIPTFQFNLETVDERVTIYTESLIENIATHLWWFDWYGSSWPLSCLFVAVMAPLVGAVTVAVAASLPLVEDKM